METNEGPAADKLNQIRRIILAHGYIIYNHQQDIVAVADSEEGAREVMSDLYDEDSDQNLLMMPCTKRLYERRNGTARPPFRRQCQAMPVNRTG